MTTRTLTDTASAALTYRGCTIEQDEEGYFASAGGAAHFGYCDSIESIKEEIDDHWFDEAEHYGDPRLDTPSLDTSFRDGEQAA